MTPGQLIIGYHGCDATTRDDLVSGRISTLNPSRNRYDWLGEGVYFFEGDIDRALIFADNSHQNPRKMYTRRAIATPAVVGATLCIKHCLDMTTQWGVRTFRGALQELTDSLDREGLPSPTNEAVDAADRDVLLRNLDAAVFNVIRKAKFGMALEPIQAVRGAFHQGEELAPRSGFRQNSHIQIALRDPACIVGWFLPPGVAQLSAAAYAEARQSQKKMESDRKPRSRAASRRGAQIP